MIRSPADLGFDATAYELPPLVVNQVSVGTNAQAAEGMLFALEASSLSERRRARKYSITQRVAACAEQVNATDGAWIIWCELNAEADALREAIPEAVEIRGSDPSHKKEKALHDFAHGDIRVLITKPKIAGFGLNWQHCRNVALSESLTLSNRITRLCAVAGDLARRCRSMCGFTCQNLRAPFWQTFSAKSATR